MTDLAGHPSDGLWQRLWRTFLSGLATVLPVGITLYLVWWLLQQAESLFGGLVRVVLPDGWYFPGLGILVAIGVVLLVGAFLNAWLFARLVDLGEAILSRIPLVKTVYTGLRDILGFLSRSGGESDLKQVVSVEIQPEVHVIGFVTDNDVGQGLPELARDADDPLVSVYMPMGYQVGGYTLYLPESRLQPLDLSIEQAMRVVLTAGVNRPHSTGGDGNRG
ncbi:DUF502 domain-containing protein [Halofilum ochraceum]|uniref:DUF502 domain-containing protein n=1 Tax=Halofilum ochraceum TaxID=1611323 RepID=UPI001585D5F6|nr:DUF502 domain-containing protein [Halofilum ochraceum]